MSFGKSIKPSRMVIIGTMLTISVAAVAQTTDRTSARARLLRQSIGESEQSTTPPTQTISYGRDPAQVFDYWRGSATEAAPLILFVHGGGWQHGSRTNTTGQWKPEHYNGLGYRFASTDYRLVPNARVEDQAADIARALRVLVDRARELGIDRNRIVLMGHSAGAHLVALVGTDPRYLQAVGLSLADIKGVVPLDGAAYDVPRQVRDGPPVMKDTYALVFGDDPARQRALSPFYQAAKPNAAAFYIPHVQRPDGVAQSNALAAALTKAGTPVQTLSLPGTGLKGHAEINRRMGDPSYEGTGKVDEWLKGVFAH